MTIINEVEIEEIAAGSAIYGTGGGGDPYLGKLLARKVIRDNGPVELVSIDEFDSEDLIIPVAMAGAPSVILEKLPQIEPMISALRALERHLGKAAKGLVSIEVGGINSTIPFCVASHLGLPLIDGDTMGRAFPELQMTLCTLNGISPSPAVIADEKGNVFTLEVPDAASVERFVRNITMDMGGSAYLALYPMSAAQLGKALVPGSISAARAAGKALFDARARHADPIAAVVCAVSGFCLFKGKVTDVQRRIDGRFSFGQASLAGLDDYAAQQATLKFQNEFLLVSNHRRVLCSTPDLIVLLDLESGEPVTAEQTRFGLRVAVLAIPCVQSWRTNAALALVGPRRFGYETDYVPVERLVMER
jgi:DUF917 family protein